MHTAVAPEGTGSKSVRHLPLAQLEATTADANVARNLRERPAVNSTQLNSVQHLSTFRLRVNRPLMVWLAARRQGPPRCAEVHLDDARFAKDRWRLRLHAGSVTVVIIWHETRRAGGFQPATSDRAPDCRASDALQTGLPPAAR